MDADQITVFCSRDIDVVARALLGCVLRVGPCSGRVIETEAYDTTDAASHSFRGPTARNRSMFGAVGCLYVYRSYGLHWCANIVAGERPGGAVLLRAIMPLDGVSTMVQRRQGPSAALRSIGMKQLCNGPGKLAQALGIDDALDGSPLWRRPLRLTVDDENPRFRATARIGITKATDRLRRYVLV